MPTGPRPSEVSSWFKNGRPFVGKNVPNIDSIKTFEAKWITWWSAAQPLWQDTKNWPFVKGKATAKDWGHLPDGGKDGLFPIVVSLAWWGAGGIETRRCHCGHHLGDQNPHLLPLY